jgi:hypothetical protein
MILEAGKPSLKNSLEAGQVVISAPNRRAGTARFRYAKLGFLAV